MRLLADENVPRASIDVLRHGGHDVASVAERAPRTSDIAVLEMARTEDRVLVTFDRDFGALVYRERIPALSGVIYLRFVPKTPFEAGELLVALAKDAELRFEGYFSVVDRSQVRRRKLMPDTP